MLWQADEPLRLQETLSNAAAAYHRRKAVTGVFCATSSLYTRQLGKSLSLPSLIHPLGHEPSHRFSLPLAVTSGKVAQ